MRAALWFGAALMAAAVVAPTAQAQQQTTTQAVCSRQCYYGQCSYSCTQTSTPVAQPEAPRKATGGSTSTVRYDADAEKRKSAGAGNTKISSDMCRSPYHMTEKDGCQLRGR